MNEKGRAYSTHGERRGAYKFEMRKLEGKLPLGRPKRRWEDIKMSL